MEVLMEASVIHTQAYCGSDTYIESISYNCEYLTIIVFANPDNTFEIKFKQPIGFRCLDESNLLEFWENNVIINNWLLEIHNSGWLAQESLRYGFLSKNQSLTEYLIKGQNDCVNIISLEQPQIRLINNEVAN